MADLNEFGARVLREIEAAKAEGRVFSFFDTATLPPADPAYLAHLAHTKRFLECWMADPDFRRGMVAQPAAIVRRRSLAVDPEEIRSLWDARFIEKAAPAAPITLPVLRYRSFMLERRFACAEKARRESAPSNPSFRAWRERQIHRARTQLSDFCRDGVIHVPFGIELSEGCSGACWFCALSAPRLKAVFRHSAENARLWRDTLGVLQEFTGPAAAQGFCYWATDPLDNPDYEKFAAAFREILGAPPKMTTALALKDPRRTCRLLALATEQGSRLNRFTIRTLPQLRRLHRLFTAEEMLFVELVLQNRESLQIKTRSGRAVAEPATNRILSGTAACITGFLLNMVRRSVRLITPCEADVRNPLGYLTLAEDCFESPSDLRLLLERWIARHMPMALRSEDRLAWRQDLTCQTTADGLELRAPYGNHSFRGNPLLPELGRLITPGTADVGTVVETVHQSAGTDPATLFHLLNVLFQNGVLDEQPLPS